MGTILPGTMMDEPLLLSTLIEHAAVNHGTTEIVSRDVDGAVTRYTYADAHVRAKKLAQALDRLGVEQGDRVGTLAWNTHRHFEMFYGVSGTGAVLHTINPRLFREQLLYIINHCEDKWIFFDLATADLVRDIAPELCSVRGYCFMGAASDIPDGLDLVQLCAYEDLLEAEDGHYSWPTFDEKAASSICYTSGTTGPPKGVVYTHRAMMLSALTLAARDFLGFMENGKLDVAIGLSPMFHGNAWQLPYLGPLLGMKLVWPGRHLDGESLANLMRDENANIAFGVPTFWLIIHDYLEQSGKTVPDLHTALSAGATPPGWLVESLKVKYGVDLLNVWGMTECLGGSVGSLKPGHNALAPEDQIEMMRRSGRPNWGARIRIVSDGGEPVPRDNETLGNLEIRGPFIASGYFHSDDESPLSPDGWFRTGDIAVWDKDSYFELRDRAKDVIKSGGEWISSVEIENVLLAHPDISQVAVIAIAHPKWQERPLAVCQCKTGSAVDKAIVLSFLKDKIADWWMPDDVAFIDEIPMNSTGKVFKIGVREKMIQAGYDVVIPGSTNF